MVDYTDLLEITSLVNEVDGWFIYIMKLENKTEAEKQDAIYRNFKNNPLYNGSIIKAKNILDFLISRAELVEYYEACQTLKNIKDEL